MELDKMKNVLIGYSRFTSKKGADCLIARVLVKCSPTRVAFGHSGYEVQELFMPEHLFAKFNVSVIGKVMDVKYDGHGRYAEIEDVSFSDVAKG